LSADHQQHVGPQQLFTATVGLRAHEGADDPTVEPRDGRIV
jgi:hypothetical protein